MSLLTDEEIDATIHHQMGRLDEPLKSYALDLCCAIEAATAAKLNERIADLQAKLDAAAVDAELVSYILQDDIQNRLTPRVVDIAYSAFVIGRSGENKDDSGPCDWFNDTKPMVLERIGKIRKELSIDAMRTGEPKV